MNPAGSACRYALRVNHDIVNDARIQLPQEFRAGQNIAAAAILLQTLSEPEDPAQRDLHRQVRNLVELAAVQRAESSSLNRRQAAASCLAGGASHGGGGASHGGRETSEVQRVPPAR